MAAPTPTNIVRAQISVGVAAGAMDVALIAGTAGLSILVLAMSIVSDDDCNIYFQSSGDVALFGDTSDRVLLAASSILTLPYNPIGWMLCPVAEAFEVISASDTFELAGCIVYTKI